jgi:hypothetical protein
MTAIKLEVTAPGGGSTTGAPASPLLCDWTSAAQLVGQIQADKLNATDVVSQCANVCQVAFNSSSAPGVSLSWNLRSLCKTNEPISHLLVKE